VLPKEISELFQLRFIFLEGARGNTDYELGNLEFITGGIPPEIGLLDELLILDLNFNKIDGQVSSCL